MTPDISDAAAQSVAGYTGLMLAQTVAHTNGQTLGKIIYKIKAHVAT